MEWLPLWASNLLRLMLWLALVIAAVWMSWNAAHYDSTKSAICFRAALFLVLMQQAILHVQRWDQPLTYESLISYPALVLVFVGLVSERRARIRG